jgi:ABC-type transport system substrate-binding protein
MSKFLFLLLFVFLVQAKAEWNNPYLKKEGKEKIIYRSFGSKPKSLDPAISYYSDEMAVICQIYEPLLQYKFLKRPFELEPLLAEKLPSIKYVDDKGEEILDVEKHKGVVNSIWTIQMKKGIKYQNHPCFTKNEKGDYKYHQFSKQTEITFTDLFDLPNPSTRETKIQDFVYQIYRLADSRNNCPIVFIVEKIKGMDLVMKAITNEVESIRKQRAEISRNRGDLIYNREEDEKENPIIIDYLKIPCAGIKIIDDYTMEITLTEKYPQFQYWLSMTFFCPIPWEAVHFYEQKAVKAKNFSLLAYPVGTGPFKFEKCNRNARMILSRNENYHDEFFPSEAIPEFKELTKDAGKKLPLVDKIIWTKEPEVTSQWIKFQQGYLESATIPEHSFTSSIDFNDPNGGLTPEMKNKKIKLIKAPRTSIWYIGFNMLDPIVGGNEDKKCKLRQAISIAIDSEEYIKTFSNGRGIVAQNILPPGIFGYKEGKEGVNPYVFDWDATQNKANLKNISFAKKLLEEAGFPNGVNTETGKQLVLFLDCAIIPASQSDWYKSQLSKINITLVIRDTDNNRLAEKYDNGNYQIFMAGWNADYPDPENFLFLFYGPNGKVKFKGENNANYTSAEFDQLFNQIKSMENTPARMELINQAVEIIRRDAPWKLLFYPVDYVLYHDWYENYLAGGVINNSSKYQNILTEDRILYRDKMNRPDLFWPLSFLILITSAFILTAFRFLKKEMN